MRFSAFALLKHAWSGRDPWVRQWRAARPRREYEVLIVGGGGHGLATAYHLAKDQGIDRVAVLERGWLGGGNTARNTTVIRSNYLLPESAALYDHALKLWGRLAQELNYNVMFSPRGVLMLAHSRHDVHGMRRQLHANRAAGIDSEWLSPAAAQAFCPPLDVGPRARYPVLGGALQRRGGVARHDAVAWGYARAASALGVDLVERCPVIRLVREPGGPIRGVETPEGFIAARRVAVVTAGYTSTLLGPLGVALPIESVPLQALVSEPVKPVLPCVVMSNTVHAYVSQSDKGELVIGAGTDPCLSYRPSGTLPALQRALEAVCELFPSFRRLRMLRSWGGVVDLTPDRSPILDATPVPGLYVNAGWGTGGFKATPGSGQLFAELIARGSPPPLLEPFGLERFLTGRLIDEAAAAAVAH